KAIVARFPFLLLVARLVVAKQAPVQEQMSIPEHLLQVGAPIPSFIGKATNHNWQHMLAVAASSTTNTTVTNSSSTNQSSQESCFPATMEACFASVDCLLCAASGPADCNEIDVVDCESYWDSLCCTYGTSDACMDNTLLVDLVACFGEFLCRDGEVDEICRDGYVRDPDWGDDDGGGDDFLDSDIACLPEAVACSMSSECTECAAVLDLSSETTTSEGDCPPYNNTGCADFADAMCCLYGSSPTCREDEEMNEYIDCLTSEYFACAADGLCDDDDDDDDDDVSNESDDDVSNESDDDVSNNSDDDTSGASRGGNPFSLRQLLFCVVGLGFWARASCFD
ncbi:unnamed protein product, partial [Ectocarpus sp. 13 AM-2016]